MTSPVRFAADSIRKQGFRLMCGDSELRLCVDLRHLSNGFYRTLGYNLTEFPRCRISRSEYAVGVLGPPATSGYNPYVIAIVSRWNHDVLLGRNRLLRKLGVLPASLICNRTSYNLPRAAIYTFLHFQVYRIKQKKTDEPSSCFISGLRGSEPLVRVRAVLSAVHLTARGENHL